MTLAFWFGESGPSDGGESLASRRRLVRVRDAQERDRDADDADHAIIAQIKAGDQGALKALYDKYAAALHRFVTALVHSPDDASEVVTDVFVSVWERRAAIVIRGSVAGYLFGAARNRARNLVRDAQTRSRIEAKASPHGMAALSPYDGVERADLAATVLRVLRSFPDPGRTAALLRWTAELSYAEIGAALGMSAGAAQVHVSRVLKALRSILPSLSE